MPMTYTEYNAALDLAIKDIQTSNKALARLKPGQLSVLCHNVKQLTQAFKDYFDTPAYAPAVFYKEGWTLRGKECVYLEALVHGAAITQNDSHLVQALYWIHMEAPVVGYSFSGRQDAFQKQLAGILHQHNLQFKPLTAMTTLPFEKVSTLLMNDQAAKELAQRLTVAYTATNSKDGKADRSPLAAMHVVLDAAFSQNPEDAKSAKDAISHAFFYQKQSLETEKAAALKAADEKSAAAAKALNEQHAAALKAADALGDGGAKKEIDALKAALIAQSAQLQTEIDARKQLSQQMIQMTQLLERLSKSQKDSSTPTASAAAGSDAPPASNGSVNSAHSGGPATMFHHAPPPPTQVEGEGSPPPSYTPPPPTAPPHAASPSAAGK